MPESLRKYQEIWRKNQEIFIIEKGNLDFRYGSTDELELDQMNGLVFWECFYCCDCNELDILCKKDEKSSKSMIKRGQSD